MDVAVTSTTSSQYFRVIHVSLSVSDVNDNAPRFSPASVVVNVSEDVPLGTTVALPRADDDDVGENSRLSFEVRWNGSAVGKLDFRVSEVDGTVALGLVVVGRLDRETEDVYSATVTAVDAGTPPRTGSLNVVVRVTDANDNVPVFESELYEATIREDLAAGATVAQVRAVDADTGANGAVRYRLGRQSAAVYGAIFAVDDVTGAVTLRRRLDSRPPDGVYRLRVVAVDQGPDAVVVHTNLIINVVDVNNHAPSIRLPRGRRLEVLENQPAGTQVSTYNSSLPCEYSGNQSPLSDAPHPALFESPGNYICRSWKVLGKPPI